MYLLIHSLKMQVGSVFSNFEEFAKSFDKFQKETHQLFVRFKSSTIEFKNSTSNNGKYNTDLKWYYVYYMCKHGGKPRHSGNGVSRPSQKLLIVSNYRLVFKYCYSISLTL